MDIYELMMNVRDLNEKTKESIEDNFVIVTAPFQKSEVQWQDALLELKGCFENFLAYKICLLTSNKTRFRGFTHRFSFSMIMPNKAKQCMQSLCNETFYFDQGSKLFFQFDKG